jgi:hypothetical protein
VGVRTFTLSFCGGWNFDGEAGSESVICDLDRALLDRTKQRYCSCLARRVDPPASSATLLTDTNLKKTFSCVMRSNFVRFRGRRGCPGIESKIA